MSDTALDAAVARMAGRLAGVLDRVGGDAPAVVVWVFFYPGPGGSRPLLP